MTSQMIDELTVQLRRDEGEVLHEYKDHLGYSTIGVGRLIDQRKGGCISREESAYLLRNDINRIDVRLQELFPWIVTLSGPRRGVLMNMAFQMGIDGLKRFKKFLLMVEQQEYQKASTEMLDSTWARQTPERAKRLSEQMRLDCWK